MAEYTFPTGDWSTDDATATTIVAELTEELLEQISRPRHRWPRFARETARLHAVTSAMAERYPTDGDDDDGPIE